MPFPDKLKRPELPKGNDELLSSLLSPECKSFSGKFFDHVLLIRMANVK